MRKSSLADLAPARQSIIPLPISMDDPSISNTSPILPLRNSSNNNDNATPVPNTVPSTLLPTQAQTDVHEQGVSDQVLRKSTRTQQKPASLQDFVANIQNDSHPFNSPTFCFDHTRHLLHLYYQSKDLFLILSPE